MGVIIVRKSHKEGWLELATLFNLKGRDAKYNLSRSIKTIAFAPFKWVKANLSNQGIPQIHIDIKFKHWLKLVKKREEALKVKILLKDPDDYVPGKIRFRGKTVNVKLRLKGDWVDHLEGDKWSFRIHVKGDNHLLGMRRFSIQNPRTRKFESEILYFEALKREGVLVPRYFFIEVFVNGKNIGLMALEEHFSNEMLNSQGRRESVIVKFDESLSWTPQRDLIFDSYELTKITAFRSNKIARSENLSSDLNIARGLLRAFVNKKLPPSKVFDPVLMGRFIAVSDVWRAWHQLGHWGNYRFYYNPVTALLEPIGFDGNISHAQRLREPSPFSMPVVSAIVHGDPEIRQVYQETVEKLAREIEEGITENWARPLSEKQMAILHKEFPFLQELEFDLIKKRTQETHHRIQATFKRYPELLQAYLVKEEMGFFLELVNPLPHGLEVQDIKCAGKTEGENSALNFHSSFTLPLLLNPTSLGDLPEIHRVAYQLRDKDCRLKVKVKIVAEDIVQWVEAQNYSPILSQHPQPEMTLEKTLAEHPFLIFDKASQTLNVKPGKWEVKTWLAIPHNVELKISQGTTLQFDPESGLLARGSVTISGTENNPVVLMGRGNQNLWQGLSVLKSKKPSIWNYVTIRNTKGINNKGWVLPGGR